MTKKIFKLIIATAIIFSFKGCTKILPIERTGYANQYEVSAEGDTGFVPLQGVYLKAQNAAKEKCKSLDSNYHQISKELIPTAFAVFPRATIIFECNNNLIETKQKIMIINNKSLSDKLKTIEKLYKDKLISTEEYHKKRDSLLNEF
jgi:hypothetical protein